MSANMPDWIAEFPGGVTVSGKDGTILYLNDRAAKTFESDGGQALVGKDLMACHKTERAKAIIKRIMETEEPNVYTIEKRGQKKLIFQAPWYEDGELGGLVELSLVIPEEMPHFKRD
jgi:transcriptional regulator with PAS, ATPase and Fis domain